MTLDDQVRLALYRKKYGPLIGLHRHELLLARIAGFTAMAHGIKDESGQALKPGDFSLLFHVQENEEATPEDMKRMFGVKSDG